MSNSKQNPYNEQILKQSYYDGMSKKDVRMLFRNYNAYREVNRLFLRNSEKTELLILQWDSENGYLPKHKIERLNFLLRGKT